MNILEIVFICLKVFDIGRGSNIPITGIEFHCIPNSDNHFIVVTTLERLYEFGGSASNVNERPFFQQVFNGYLNKAGKTVTPLHTKLPFILYTTSCFLFFTEQFVSLMSKLRYSKLQFYYPGESKLPTQCAWLVEKGLFCGEVCFKGLRFWHLLGNYNLIPNIFYLLFFLSWI